MGSVGLLFVGAVLFVNGLMLLGLLEPRAAAPMNLFVGGLQTVVPLYLIATADTTDEILLASGIFLFGFTYLYVGIGSLASLPVNGVGWYSLWVVLLATAFAVVSFDRFDDPKMGLIWAHWAVLWGLFWLVLALDMMRLTWLTGWVTVVMSFTTCTIPAFIMLLGEWTDLATGWMIGVTIAEAVLYLGLLVRSAPGTPSTTSTTATPSASP